MNPTKFKQSNVIFAEDQPDYLPLPAYKEDSPHGCVVTCWQLTWKEKIKLLFGGSLFLSMLTFNQPLQPIKLGTSFEEVL